jgi:hypothetical protein
MPANTQFIGVVAAVAIQQNIGTTICSDGVVSLPCEHHIRTTIRAHGAVAMPHLHHIQATTNRDVFVTPVATINDVDTTVGF